MEVYSRWQRSEAVYENVATDVRARVEQARKARDERFDRLLDNMQGHDNSAHHTARIIQEGLVAERQKASKLHAAWEDSVFDPLMAQASRHLNPPDRLAQQRLLGSKSVGFQIPDEQFRLAVREAADPLKRALTEDARERRFHEAATSILQTSRSAPELRAGAPPGVGRLLPRARRRPTLPPTRWGQVHIQGTMAGHFAQVCEHEGPGFRRDRRSGAAANLDEADGVPYAGTKVDRQLGRHDKGILRGGDAILGMSAGLKRASGAGSGAPAQDHFSFARGGAAADVEFPLGKRTFHEQVVS